MSFLTEKEVTELGFKSLGKNVLISNKASIYGASNISVGDNVRVDDFVILSSGCEGIDIGSFVHIGVHSSLIGSGKIIIEDFVGISGRVSIYSSCDDFMGLAMNNPTVPSNLTRVTTGKVELKKHALIGCGCTVLPNVTIEEGVSVGAMSLVNKDLHEWNLYSGNPIQKLSRKAKKPLELENKLSEYL